MSIWENIWEILRERKWYAVLAILGITSVAIILFLLISPMISPPPYP